MQFTVKAYLSHRSLLMHFELTNFVQNVSIRLKIKLMSGKSVSI